MRAFKTEGIIIKRRNYSEADRILTVFTKYYGKIQVKAMGIRRIPSRRSAHVELLNFCSLSLYKGNGYPILTEAQSLENFSAIKDDFNKVGLAFHLCELIDGLCPENQEHREIFSLFINMLTRLSQEPCSSPVIRQFEIDLLATLGYSTKADMIVEKFDTRDFIENILERRLKSRDIFSKLQ